MKTDSVSVRLVSIMRMSEFIKMSDQCLNTQGSQKIAGD